VLQCYGFKVDCLEAGEDVGGIWNIERGGGGYRSLYANTHISAMRYDDFPFPEGTADFPTAGCMVDYFRGYADHNALWPHLQFGRRVQAVEPGGEQDWRVTLADGEQRHYRAVVLATGQYVAPRRPHDQVPGNFEGDHLYVMDYLDPQTPLPLAGKRVLVVGLGTSAAEVAAELSRSRDDQGQDTTVIVAARSGRWVIPKAFGGGAGARLPHPSDPLTGLLRWLPAPARTALMRRVMGRMIRDQFQKLGGAEGLGVPEPSREPWQERPTLSTEFVQALQDGLIDVRGGIERFEGRRVLFQDGTEAEVDAILYGTGYERAFPYLSREVLGSDDKDIALYQRVMVPGHPGLFALGCLPVMCALWPLAEQQSHWVARLLRGDFRVPSVAAQRRKAVTLREAMPVMCNAYVAELRRQAGGF
jgi:cation diffusion facilitator CzcD-associated flavoprotein CzcO